MESPVNPGRFRCPLCIALGQPLHVGSRRDLLGGRADGQAGLAQAVVEQVTLTYRCRREIVDLVDTEFKGVVRPACAEPGAPALKIARAVELGVAQHGNELHPANGVGQGLHCGCGLGKTPDEEIGPAHGQP